MLLGLWSKLVELLLLLPELPLKSVLSSPDLNKNITSEPLVLMLLVTSIKKLPSSKLLPQIMVVKLLLLDILLTKSSKTVLKMETN